MTLINPRNTVVPNVECAYENPYRDTMYQCQADIRRNEPEERAGK